MATVSYGLQIKKSNHVFDDTLEVFRDAVNYIMEIALLHYDEIIKIQKTDTATAEQMRRQYVENLIHTTKNSQAKYTHFDEAFCDFPSYLRRSAITTAIGNIVKYKKEMERWEAEGKKTKAPRLNRNQSCMPCFYRGNTFEQEGTAVSLKLYNAKKKSWVWHDMNVRKTDFLYVLRHVSDWKAAAPVLVKRHHKYELRIAYTIAGSKLPSFLKDKDVTTVVGVDLGINTDATCSVVNADGTVAGQCFINSPVEKDRMYKLLNVIRKAQQNGNYRNHRLWRFVDNYNTAIAVHTAEQIVRFAAGRGAKVVVFEHLSMKGKIRGGKKQKLALWRKREIQHRTEELASRYGIRVSYVSAVNTSKLAFDGSGEVLRGEKAGLPTYELCKFQTGKVYNCDLSASKNIAARYFLRVILKSIPAKELLSLQAKVPELCKRTSCTLSTLISLCAVLYPSKAEASAPAA